MSEMTWAEYHALDALNWSRLKAIARSPAHYQWALTERMGDTDALRVGRALHAAVLEPRIYKERFVSFDGTRRGKAWDDFSSAAAARGQEVLKFGQMLMVQSLMMAVRRHPEAARLLTGGRAEVTHQWTLRTPSLGDFPERARPAKARLDYLGPSGIVELKSAKDARPESFGRDAWNLGYLGQAAWYVDAVLAETGEEVPFHWVVVEKSPPFVVSVFALTPDLLEVGREFYRDLLARLDLCEREQRWPGYVDGVAPLALPRWLRPDDDDEDVSGLDLEFSSEGDDA